MLHCFYRICPEDEPLSFRDFKEDITKDFQQQEQGPSLIKDFDLLEEELTQGSIYMKQSKDLRATVDQVILFKSDLLYVLRPIFWKTARGKNNSTIFPLSICNFS